MASQRITIAKLAGVSADVALKRLHDWSNGRRADDSNLMDSEQWPSPVREAADEFADKLRANALTLPVVHFVEWVDRWLMGDTIRRWLTPPHGSGPSTIFANKQEIYAYGLPDGGRLVSYLHAALPQQFVEYDVYVRRLIEATQAWDQLVDRSAVVVLRRVVGGSALDQEVKASLLITPAWLS